MPCPSTDLQNRRVIHACTPTPIVRGIAKAESRPFGLNRWVFRVPLALAVVLALKDLIGGAL